MFHVKHQAWDAELDALGIALDPERLELLETFLDMLLDRALPRGFVSPSDVDRLWERHIRDSLRAFSEIAPGSRVADLGSGAGLPGLPLAIASPGASFTLIELRRGRAAFLESVVDELGLPNAEVFFGKVADVPGSFDVCTARAFSSAGGSWTAAAPHLGEHGQLIYWAGSGFRTSDLDDLGVSWRVSTSSGLADSGPLVIMGRQ
jgi:16S rRNA (guanine527-N7)-methyltransferase